MSMWLQDIEQMSADELEGLCEELEMKLDEGRKELTRKEEAADDDLSQIYVTWVHGSDAHIDK